MEMYEDLISVIVPVYNVEKYICQCVDSILAQTYKNLEIILVDDGTKDKSGIICDEYVQKEARCKVIHKKNEGLGMARNSGMEVMTGKYVTFVDSDDWLDEHTIEELYKGMKRNNVDFCKSGFRRVTDKGVKIKKVGYSFEYFPGIEAKKNLLPRCLGASPSRHDSVEMCVWGVIYKTEIILKYGLLFPSERVMISEDLVFNTEYMQYANGGCLIPFVGYQYRYNLNSLSTSYRPDRMNAVVHFYQVMAKRLDELGYKENAIIRLQKTFLVYIRMCIVQETRKISGLKYTENITNVKKICKNPILRNVIAEYPVEKLGFKQKLFIELILHEQVRILCFLSERGILKA